jgi:transposase
MRKAGSVYVLFCAFKTFKMIERSDDCEIRSVIRFLNARNVKPADIHRQICEAYGENVMSDGLVRKWVRKFKEGRDSVHDEPRSGRPSVVTGGHVLRGRVRETGAPLC